MTKNEFKQLVNSKVVVLDGATGTQLALHGMGVGVSPELYVFENPEVINKIHNAYFAAGSDIVYIPSFGGNRCKLAEFGLEDRLFELNSTLARNAKLNAQGKGYVFGDVSPTGEFLKPWGSLDFEELVAIYAEQISALAQGGADGIAIETMLDLQQTRAALIAAKETAPELPVIVTLTFDEHGRTLSGNDALSSLITMQSLGADAFGCNCSTGPEQMIELLKGIKPYADIPLIAKPNAGMPKLINDETVFEMTPQQFGSFAQELVDAGVNIAGGCCGTSPEHIAVLAKNLSKMKPSSTTSQIGGMICSGSKSVNMNSNGALRIIGERINPTGKKRLQAELRAGSLELVAEFARQQTEQGAALLDVNVGLGGIDETTMMLQAIEKISQVSDLPLCIDSTDPQVMELALRNYCGRALVNSISAETDRIENLLPLAAKYGAMIILLPVADGGIPETVDERITTIKDIFAHAQKFNYRKCDVVVDALIMTVATDNANGRNVLELIQWATNEFGVGTTGGLSNVSFGLPERSLLNSTFLAMAMARGLSSVIANPASEVLLSAVTAADVLRGNDEFCSNYLAKFGEKKEAEDVTTLNASDKVKQLVVSGRESEIVLAVEEALNAGFAPADLLDNALIAGINVVGGLFSEGKYFLPQLLMSADTMRRAIAILEPLLSTDAVTEKREKVVIATVEGDIHDIGKNIVALMLRNYGFDVLDLGKDVPASEIIAKVKEHDVRWCGLSALMTTTMPRMREVIELAQKEGLTQVKFIVGGAAVDANYAQSIGAIYAKDAMDTVRLCQG